MKRIYLDVCCFNRPFDVQEDSRIRKETEAKLDIQESIRLGKVELVWSYVLDYENAANPFIERRKSIEPWRNLAVKDIIESKALIERAQQLSESGFKPLDALHIACAIMGGCELFLTTDDGIVKHAEIVSGVEILNPIEAAHRLQA